MRRRLPAIVIVPAVFLLLVGPPIAAIAFASAYGRSPVAAAPAAGHPADGAQGSLGQSAAPGVR